MDLIWDIEPKNIKEIEFLGNIKHGGIRISFKKIPD